MRGVILPAAFAVNDPKIGTYFEGKGYVGLFLCLSVLSFARDIEAQTPACDKLTGDKKSLAASLLNSQYPYDCCDDTIASCLKAKPTCALAHRLAENICRRVSKNEDKARIVRILELRARSMMPQKEVAIELTDTPMAGQADAPVVLVEYACARCPYCGKLTPKIYQAVVDGPLKGKVRLYFKTFPIRGHPFSKEAGQGFLAAQRLGRFWRYALYVYEHFEEYCVNKQREWAERLGMDGESFEKAMADPVIRERLVESKKEGLVNGVDATPALFINGRKYFGDLDPEELVDVLEEEYERVKGARTW